MMMVTYITVEIHKDFLNQICWLITQVKGFRFWIRKLI